MTENDIGTIVVCAAIAVHRELGPGLLETVYEVTLAHELEERGLVVSTGSKNELLCASASLRDHLISTK